LRKAEPEKLEKTRDQINYDKNEKISFNLIFMTLLSGLWIGCSSSEKKEEIPGAEPSIIMESQSGYVLRSSLQNLTLDSIRVIFNEITPQNRYDLTVDKLNHVLTLPINSIQKGIITEIRDNLTPQCFDWNSAQHLYFANTFLPNRDSLLANNFTSIQGLNVFFNLYDLTDLDQGIPNQGTNNNPPCSCNLGGFFGGCQILGNVCDEQSCGSTHFGCGFMGFYSCTGLCDDVPTPTSNSNYLYP
jgi:hypothetical protein